MKAGTRDWEALVAMPVREIQRLIRDAGLSEQRATRLKGIAERLLRDFGRVTLEAVADYDDGRALDYLSSLPGVGVKTAKCVMMYSLGRQVLPVDTHTARVGVWLGLVAAAGVHGVDHGLSEVVPPGLRYDFHVNAVAHGSRDLHGGQAAV